MEEFFDNIFARIALWILIISVIAYALIKWIIPFIIKKIKERNKTRKDKKEYELEEKFNNVEIVTKDVEIKEIPKQEMEVSQNLTEVSYVPNEEAQGKLEINTTPIQENGRDEEFEAFLNEIEKENNKSVKKEIKSASPKLKGIILSGVLQDKKF